MEKKKKSEWKAMSIIKKTLLTINEPECFVVLNNVNSLKTKGKQIYVGATAIITITKWSVIIE